MEIPDLSQIMLFRKKLGWTQKQLANKAGLSQSMIAKIESGKKNPSLETARIIFSLLKTEHESQIHHSRISAGKISTYPIITIVPEANIAEAIHKMGNLYDQIPVVNHGVCVGCITSNLILNLMASSNETNKHIDEYNVEECMQDSLPMIGEQTPLTAVNSLLRVFPAVLTMNHGKLTGIISRMDLITHSRTIRNR